MRPFVLFLYGICQILFSSSSSSSSLVTEVSSCTSTSVKTRRLQLHCAEGHVRILKAFLGSMLENRYFGCFHHREDCVAVQEFPYCEGSPSCDVEVPKQKQILCTSASNDRRRIFSMSAYLQISYECAGKRPRKQSVCLSGPSGGEEAMGGPALAVCDENQYLQILNVFEGKKSYERSQALSISSPMSACTHHIGDDVFQSPFSASIRLGCNGLRTCRLPSSAVRRTSSSYSYVQLYYACLVGNSFIASRCIESPPNTQQDHPGADRYLALDCVSSPSSSSSSAVIVILNAFVGSRDSPAVDATSCVFEPRDTIQLTNVQTCEGRRRCFLSLKDQVARHSGYRPLYMQVHYRCLESTAMKPDLIPSSSFSNRDYVSDDGSAVINVAPAAAVSSRNGGGGIDHTSTIIGGIICTVAVISAFVIAIALNQKWKRKESVESARREEEGEEEELSVKGDGSEAAAVNKSVKGGPDVVPTNSAHKNEENQAFAVIDPHDSLFDLSALADARLRSNQSPKMPRKIDDLPEECRIHPPENIKDFIEKGEIREFYV